MKALRAKIGADRVRTVHGVGYALEPGAAGVSAPLLDQVTSVKVKLGLLVAVSVTVAAVVAAHRAPRRTCRSGSASRSPSRSRSA